MRLAALLAAALLLSGCAGDPPAAAPSTPPSRSALNKAACEQLVTALEPLVMLKTWNPAEMPVAGAGVRIGMAGPIDQIAELAEGETRESIRRIGAAVATLDTRLRGLVADVSTEMEALTLTVQQAGALCLAENVVLPGELRTSGFQRE